jgi:hypothetical protein
MLSAGIEYLIEILILVLSVSPGSPPGMGGLPTFTFIRVMYGR